MTFKLYFYQLFHFSIKPLYFAKNMKPISIFSLPSNFSDCFAYKRENLVQVIFVLHNLNFIYIYYTYIPKLQSTLYNK